MVVAVAPHSLSFIKTRMVETNTPRRWLGTLPKGRRFVAICIKVWKRVEPGWRFEAVRRAAADRKHAETAAVRVVLLSRHRSNKSLDSSFVRLS